MKQRSFRRITFRVYNKLPHVVIREQLIVGCLISSQVSGPFETRAAALADASERQQAETGQAAS